MEKRKRKTRKAKASNLWQCSCRRPDCAFEKMGALCRKIGWFLPLVTREELPEIFGIYPSEPSVDHYLREHCELHHLDRCLAGEEPVPSDAFVTEFRDEAGVWRLTLMSPHGRPCGSMVTPTTGVTIQ